MTDADIYSPDVVLFDLDGTLIDSAPGILRCLQETFAHFDLEPLADEPLRALIGPPFSATLPALIGELDLDEVLRYYRELYRAGGGMFEAALYPGIAALVEALRAGGVRLAVATSKLEDLIAPILGPMGILDCFEVRCGHDEPTRTTKTMVVGEALRRLGVDATGTVMVGDRLHDVVGARAHDVPTLGAGWGYALGTELSDAGAVAVFDTASDLARFWRLA